LVFVAIGLLFLTLGLMGLTSPIACAINGCPSITSVTYAVYWDEIFVGIVMIVLGIGLIFVSAKAKISPWQKHSTVKTQTWASLRL